MIVISAKDIKDARGLIKQLDAHDDPVMQQKLLEICLARFVMQVTSDKEKQQFVIDSFAKHVKQMIGLLHDQNIRR